jgi:hypothetical protein
LRICSKILLLIHDHFARERLTQPGREEWDAAGNGEPDDPADHAAARQGSRDYPMKDAFDLWWRWAEKPHESLLMISGDIHYPVMELSPEDRRDREKVDEAVRRYRDTCST